jgi:hypothetical protein
MVITTNIVSSNPTHGEVYFIHHYVIKFVSDLRQVVVFLQLLRFPPSEIIFGDLVSINFPISVCVIKNKRSFSGSLP